MANRPKISTKLSYPKAREGSDGDMQVRQTNLGAKLFGKVGGTWYGAPLTATAGDPVTRIGTNLSNHLAIDKDSVDIFTGGAKVATFGATAIFGQIANDASRLEIDSSGNLKIINRQGTTDSTTVAIDADGSATFTGNIVVGNAATVRSALNVEDGSTGDQSASEIRSATGWSHSSDTTLIDGGDIYATSVTAAKMASDVISGGKIIAGLMTASNIETGTLDTNTITTTSAGGNVLLGTDNNDVGGFCVLIGHEAGKVNTGNYNIAIGDDALLTNHAGQKNTCIGGEAGATIDANPGSAGQGDYNVCIGYNADVSTPLADNQIAIGMDATGHGNNIATIGNAWLSAIHPADDNGVDLGSASYSFNDIYYDGATLTSDRRLKEDITNLSLGLEFINKLNPVSYKKKDKEVLYKSGEKTPASDDDVITQRAITYKRKHTGFIAQDVKQVMDDMNISTNDFGGYVDANIKEGVDRLFLRYEEFIAPLVKAIQELSAKVDTMQTEINNLREG